MFNLQRFGDNDVVTTSTELKVKMGFGPDDDRTISLPNPKNDLTAEQINNAFSDVTVTKVIVGDKDAADFTGIKEAYKEEKTVRKLDLS